MHDLLGIRDYIVIFFLAYTVFNVKEVFFCVMHKAADILVCGTELFVFITLKFYLFFLNGKL